MYRLRSSQFDLIRTPGWPRAKWIFTDPIERNTVVNFHRAKQGLIVPSRHIALTPAVCHCSSQGLRFVI